MSAANRNQRSEFEKQVVKLALGFAKEMTRAAGSAAPGRILDACESAVLGGGRQFLRDTLQAALQDQIHEGEKRGRPHASVHVSTTATTKVATTAPS